MANVPYQNTGGRSCENEYKAVFFVPINVNGLCMRGV